MPTCPICAMPLNTIRQREGVFYLCADCTGRALTIPQLRRVAGDRFASKLMRLIKLCRRIGDHACPFCHQPMLLLEVQDPPLELAACKPCCAVWFDPKQYDVVPEGAAETTGGLSTLATEIIAETRLKELKEREEAERKKEKARKKHKLRQSLGTLWNQK